MHLGGSQINGYVVGTGGDAQGDKLKGIENLRGSAHADTLTGGGIANVLEGGAGADTLHGGDGEDTASYAGSTGGVTVNLGVLKDGWVVGTGGDADGDKLGGIENLRGSAHADTLTGDGTDNVLKGLAGEDTLKGGGGNDELDGGADADTFVFGKESVVVSDSTTELGAETDFVTDFSGLGADGVKQADEDGDKLDLSGLKEHASFTGTKLIFRGTGAFTTSADQGQVRYSHAAGNLTNADTADDRLTHVTVDVDGDGDVDFQVTLEGETDYTLTVSDLLGVEVA